MGRLVAASASLAVAVSSAMPQLLRRPRQVLRAERRPKVRVMAMFLTGFLKFLFEMLYDVGGLVIFVSPSLF